MVNHFTHILQTLYIDFILIRYIISMKQKIIILPLLLAALFTGCINRGKDIVVVSREDGSGTRGAFIELFGIEQKGTDGSKKDTTTKEALIAKQTDVMMTTVAGDKNAIGYISLGSLNDTVKALSIDGGAFKAERPFYIAIKDSAESGSPLQKEFIEFILSEQGQEVVAKSYIAVKPQAESFKSKKPDGKIVVAGSSSVTPVMEKLKEAYTSLNPYGAIEIQQSDSSAGLSACIDGICDIAMASRELKDAEKTTLTPIQIATDGIAVIVNKSNTVDNATREEVKKIFTGELSTWNAM